MKKNFLALLFFVLVSVIFISCSSKNSNADKLSGFSNTDSTGIKMDKNDLPVISFNADFHDFGKIKSGEKITFAFNFKNTGKSVLIISNVSTSCGCTVSAYPKQPIKPGEESSVDVSFDSTGKHGLQTKSISVYTNAVPAVTTLRIQSLIIGSVDN
ncbi:MAG: DUF1573 domain-containing protein [Bacteroidales bacterium]|nr:DUF1573 domain-containing protein [Bacteroidales bacterium]